MAKRAYDAEFDDAINPFGARKAWRLGLWGGTSLLSVILAMAAAYSETGSRRLASTGAAPTAAETARPPATHAASRHFDAELEARRLSEAVRLLAADRDRLLARISALERNLDDVTGSVPNGSPGGRVGNAAGAPPPATAVPSAPATAEAPHPPASGSSPAANPGPAAAPGAGRSAAAPDPAATGSVATKTEFGIDLGGAQTIDGLRTLWASVKSTHEPLLEGLRPVIAIRDGTKPGTVELRLVAGPLTNAGIAARLCAALSTAGVACQPAVFDGQRLALNRI